MAKRNQLRPTLNINVSQRLAMTPSLLQKIELLTLNQLELQDLMTQELVKNPFLEEVSDEPDSENSDPKKDAKESADETTRDQEDAFEDFDYEYFLGDYLNSTPQRREYEPNDDRPSFELFLASSSSLIDHLNWQLNLAEVDDEIREIAEYLIGNINEDGYLTTSLEEAAAAIGGSVEQAEKALRLIQTFDPLGVGARNLQECLLIQMEAAGAHGTLAERLVIDYLPQIEKKKFREIARELKCDLDDIGDAIEVIRTLCPKPGEKYSSGEPFYIRPDVYIYKIDDDYQVVANDDGLPRLRLNRAYRKFLLKGKDVSKDTKSYVKERFRSAVELLRSIDQRQQTIFRVCHAIVRKQREFLEKGRLYLKPMLIKDIAEELEVHPSTISRVVSNKYAHTPQGVIELRKFFTVGVEGSDGENVSTVHVKEKIKKIIEGEDRQKPLSDQKISKILSQDGIQITRRTVAKYRDQMRIPGSRERKMAILR